MRIQVLTKSTPLVAFSNQRGLFFFQASYDNSDTIYLSRYPDGKVVTAFCELAPGDSLTGDPFKQWYAFSKSGTQLLYQNEIPKVEDIGY